MTFAVKVAGGTGAGCRHVKERPRWFCDCSVWHIGEPPFFELEYVSSVAFPTPARHHVERVSQPGHRYSCPDCGARNPQCAAPTAS